MARSLEFYTLDGFNPDFARTNYQVLYTALVGKEDYTTLQIRLQQRILEKFEIIGEYTDDSGIPSLRSNGGVIFLESAEYKLLKDALDTTKWRGVAGKVVTRALDFFDAAPDTPLKNEGVSK